MGLVDFEPVVSAGIETFGRTVTYSPAGGTPFSLEAIYTRPHEGIAIGNGSTEISTTSPRIRVRLSDFASPPARGDTVTIDSTVFRVTDVETDIENVGAHLILRRM